MEEMQNRKEMITQKEKEISELEDRIRILKEELSELQGTRLEDCEFSTRAHTAFYYKKLKTVGDLKEYVLQDPNFDFMRGVGEKTKMEIYTFLEKN